MATVDYIHHLAFPKLRDVEAKHLAGMATICDFKDGELVFQVGRRGLPLYVVESGAIAAVDESGDEPVTVAVHGPREFPGDVSLLTGRPATTSGYARGETWACRVAQGELRRAIQEIPDLSDKLLEAFQARRKRSPRPTVARLVECLGLKRPIRGEPFDLVIVGAGPAGLAAAVYVASEGVSTLVLDQFGPGGQAGTSTRIENYMGSPAGLSGADLANRGYLQALKFGAEFVAPVEVRSLTTERKPHRLELDDGQVVSGRTVLIATGASYRRLPVAGCERWEGAGIYFPTPRCTPARARTAEPRWSAGATRPARR